MESLAQNIGGPPTPRPVLSLSASTAAVLQEGRVVAGEVIQGQSQGGVLVAIGNLRVPARAQVALEPGQRFLAKVESMGEVVVLRILSEAKASSVSPLLEALRAILPGERPIGAVLSELAGLLRSLAGGGRGADARAMLAEFAGHVFEPGSKGAQLASLLQRSGTGLEAALLSAAQRCVRRGKKGSGELRADLKARLLLARASSAHGGLTKALTKALRSIEAEQVLNLAKDACSEPRSVSIPFPDPGLEGGGWTTAWLSFLRSDEGGAAAGRKSQESGQSVRVDVELAQLGPLRAELCLDGGRLRARVVAADERAQALLRDALPSLVEALSASGLEVDASVRIGSPEEFRVAEAACGVRYLREHRLLDESA
jgi:hypothetical protein